MGRTIIKKAEEITQEEYLSPLFILEDEDMMLRGVWAIDKKGIEYSRWYVDENVAKKMEKERELDLQYSKAAAALGRKGGLVKSDRKKISSAKNGLKGGRPKKEKKET